MECPSHLGLRWYLGAGPPAGKESLAAEGHSVALGGRVFLLIFWRNSCHLREETGPRGEGQWREEAGKGTEPFLAGGGAQG